MSGSSQFSNIGHYSNRNQSGATTSSGGLASNYNFTSSTLTINQKVLNSQALGYIMQQQQHAASDITLTNEISGETLQLSNAAATSNKNVGTYSITNLSGITISDEVGANASSGALASNYTLTGGTHSFTINPKAVRYCRFTGI